MKNFDYYGITSTIWNTTLAVIALAILGGLITLSALPKHLVRYELSSVHNGVPAINKDIVYGTDETIYLNPNISFSEAVKLVDSLNNDLAKHPIKY